MQEIIRVAEENLKAMQIEELRQEGLLPLNGDFVPCINYPPISHYPETEADDLLKNIPFVLDEPLGIYIHIPFCINRCQFCHYVVSTTKSQEEKTHYLAALETEIDIFQGRFGIQKIPVRTVLFGGGTPTYLTSQQLQKFLKFFTSRFDLSSCHQFSYDVDPSTLLGAEGRERLRIMKDFGADRLTIGVQALDNILLKHMNRDYKTEQVPEAIAQARQAGFKNIGIEFIYGYPFQTIEKWAETIKKAIAFDVEEIQLYRLKIIPYGSGKGLIVKEFEKRAKNFSGEEQIFLMKELAIVMLAQKGYHENLTRVFCKSSKYISHYARDMCCNLQATAGFGLTAFSAYSDRLTRNVRTFSEYYRLINDGKLPIDQGKVRSQDEQLRWALVLPLKNSWVDKALYAQKTGVNLEKVFRTKIERLKDFGLLYEDNKKLALSEKGRFFADQVCQQFYHSDHQPFPEKEYNKGALSPYQENNP